MTTPISSYLQQISAKYGETEDSIFNPYSNTSTHINKLSQAQLIASIYRIEKILEQNKHLFTGD